MANLENESANIIDIPNGGDDISDASSRTWVVDPEIHSIAPLANIHPLANLMMLSDSFESKEFFRKKC